MEISRYEIVYLCFEIHICQAVARGLKDPSFRVIQNHFAISGNLGEVAAKVYY